MAAYSEAWAEGPPYYEHWNLEDSKAVLKALNEPEPILPPFDPSTAPPVPFKAELEAMIAEEAAKRKARDADKK